MLRNNNLLIFFILYIIIYNYIYSLYERKTMNIFDFLFNYGEIKAAEQGHKEAIYKLI
jgi:hypothetical protein